MKRLLEKIKRVARVSESVASDLLVELDYYLDGIGKMKSVIFACNPQGLEMFNEIKAVQERRRIREAVRLLEQKKLIKIKKKAKRIELSLTKKGKLESVRHQIISEDRQLPKDEVCIVVFDIPEHVRKIRDELRWFLKSAGFVQLQRSVWITTADTIRPLNILLKEMKVNNWIYIFQGRSVI
ncbi:CRISPR-associated endonuclease Cas2 [Patescibacteria group bacterium]|nr:CRISPR-associated endonuclease Cas2 [Patescibacteria group bacterium]MBU1705125.1 CRISPR-associated endonuclease Cas2 [Patescibacteria group bacterium]